MALTAGPALRLSPQEASRRILDAVREAGGEIAVAAERLRMSRRTLDRYVQKLGLEAQVHKLRPEGRKGKPRKTA